MECEHKYVFMETKKKRSNAGYQDLFERTDWFFCEKCLHMTSKHRYEYSRDIPDWY